MRVLQIGSDRSKSGVLFPGSSAYERQRTYAQEIGQLDIIGFSRTTDGATESDESGLSVHPTNSRNSLLYGLGALRIATSLQKPDVVSVQDPFEAGLIGYFIARRFRVPLHVQLHTDFLAREYMRHSLLNCVRVMIARFVLKRASRIRVVSERLMNQLTMLDLGVPISVLPIFLDVEKFRDAKLDQELANKFASFKTKLLVVSRLESEKNIALAIEAFATAAPEDSCLVIVGEGSERRDLEMLARKRAVEGRVFFVGSQDSSRYYPLADLVLVPSCYEGYGLVIVEALAAGKPVLSTDVGVAREAGAIIASPEEYAASLAGWFATGPRAASLRGYPYNNFGEYVRMYCDDIRAAAQKK